MAERLGAALLELDTDDTKYLAGARKAKAVAEKLDRDLVKTGKSSKTLGARMGALGTRLKTVALRFAAVNRTGERTDGLFKRLRQRSEGFRGTMVSMIATLGGVAFLGALISVNSEFQSLLATLETFVGDGPKAAAVFEVIKEFAAQTPFSVRELTNAFNRMLSVGITPTIRALAAFGNVASGSSKTVLDFVEAVADAAVGEFERLKEFGVKARSEGDNVTFTFKGVETTVKKSAASISEFLVRLGETEFGGAIERQAKTIGGAISNLGDGFDSFLSKIGEAGFNDALVGVIKRFTQLLGQSDGLAESIGRLLTGGLDVLESVFLGVASGIKFVIDNSLILGRAFGVLIALKLLQVVAGIGIGFVKLAAAVRVTGLTFAIFNTVHKASRVGLLLTAGILATAVGKWDSFKETIDAVIKKVKELAPSLGEGAGNALRAFGFDTSALEGELFALANTTDDAGTSIEDLDERLSKVIGSLQKAKDGSKKLSDGAKAAFKEMKDAGQTVANDLLSAFDNFLETGKFKFKDFVSSALKSLARLGAEKGLSALGSLFGGGGGTSAGASAGGTAGSFFSSFDFSSLFGGFFDKGGVPPAGKFSIVGETRPEVIVGNGRAAVEPLSNLAGGGTTINQFNDFSGVDPNSAAALEARMRRLKEETIAGAVQAVQSERGRRPGMLRGRGT